MTLEELRELVVKSLDGCGDAVTSSGHPGAVLYSGLSTLRPGRFYMLGINPSGGDTEGPPISENLCADDGTNHYLDQNWGPNGRRARLQERVAHLISILGVDPADMPSTNLAFARSTEADKLVGAGTWFQRCWPVHQALLRQVRPAWIVMLGFGKAYYFLSSQGRTLEAERPIESLGVSVAWTRRMAIDLGGGEELDVNVLAVAHPSDRGFSRAGMGGATAYADALREFVSRNVLSAATAGAV